MRTCRKKIKLFTIGAVCFGAGVLLCLFLPPVFMLAVQAIIVCAIGILFIL